MASCYLIYHLKLCLATATHNFKWMKTTHICVIWDQTFTNFDVKIFISFQWFVRLLRRIYIFIVVLIVLKGLTYFFFQVWHSQVAHVWMIVALCQTVITNHVTRAPRTIAAPVAPFTQTESALWVVLTGTITKRDVYGAATHALVNIGGNKCKLTHLVCLYVHVFLFTWYITVFVSI